MAMAERTVATRYTASVGNLLRNLGRAAKANDDLAVATDRAAAKVQANATKMSSASKRSAQEMRDALAQQGKTRANFVADQKRLDDEAAATAEKSANRRAVAAAAVVAGMGLAIAKFAEFDAQMSAVGAATGKTGDDLRELRDAAVVAGADTQYSATEAAAAITELSKAGLDATDILGGGLTGALNLAAAGQMGTADAAETMATALAQFKLGGDQATHVADLLAAGAGKAQGSVSDMAMALKQGGLVANQTGLSIEETTAGLTAFANAGLIGSDSGTAFKSMLQRLTPQSDQAQGMMDELGISAYDAGGNFIGLANFAENLRQSMKDLTPEQRNAAMSVIFGSDAVRAASVLYSEGAEGINRWTEETNQQGFAARQAATLTDNLKGDVERLGGALDTALIQGGSGANDVLRTLTKTAEGLAEGLGSIPGPVVAGTAALGAMVLLGPKVGGLAKNVTGPLSGAMQRFRDEMALQEALATTVGRGYDALGTNAINGAEKVSRASVRMGAAKAAIGGMKGAAGGLMNMLGGPWGIALAGATTAVGLWAQGQADARAAADALNATVDEQTGKFTDASRASVIESLLGALDPEDQRLVQRLGIDFGALADAALKGGPAFDQQQQHLAQLMNEYQRSGGLLSDEGRALEGLVRVYGRQGDAIDAVRVKQQILHDLRQRDNVTSAIASGNLGALDRSIDGVGDSAAGAQGPVEGMTGGLSDMKDEAVDAKTELENLMNFIDSNFGSGERAIRANQRSFNQAVRDATEGAAAKGGYDPAALKSRDEAQDALDKANARLAKARKSGKKDSIESAQGAVADAQDRLADANQRVADTYVSAAEAQEKFDGKLDDIAETGEKTVRELIKQNKPIKDINKAYDDTRAAIIKALDARGIHGKAAEDEADRIFGTVTAMDELRWQYANTQAQVATTIETPGLAEAKAGMEGYWEVIDGVPRFVPTTPTTPGLPQAKVGVQEYWQVINGVPTHVDTRFTIHIAGLDEVRTAVRLLGALPGAGLVNFGLTGLAGITSARGNIVHAYAGGGFDFSGDVANRHVPAIYAPTGTVRAFAEKETLGEAYVPLANDWRRGRAKAITSEVVSRFGGHVSWNAAGSITASSLRAGAGLSAADIKALVGGLAPGMSGRDIDRMAKATSRALAEQLPRTHLAVGVTDVQAAAMGR